MKNGTTHINQKYDSYIPGGLVQQLLCVCIHKASYTLGIHVCYGQSMDFSNPWAVLHKVAIDTFIQQIMDLLLNYIIHGCPFGTLCRVWIKQMKFCF